MVLIRGSEATLSIVRNPGFIFLGSMHGLKAKSEKRKAKLGQLGGRFAPINKAVFERL